MAKEKMHDAPRRAVVGATLTLAALLAGAVASSAYGSEDDEILYRTDVGRFAKRAQDFDVGDYVQSGLVAHFDGIRNAGSDAAHGPTTNRWTNLVTGKPDAEFINYTGDNGYWTEDGRGFYFGGVGKNCYARLTEGLTLGSSLTVQIAVDVKTSEQSGGTAGGNRYPGYFHGGKDYDFGIYSANNSGSIKDAIIFKGGSESSRPSVSAWGGRYATAMIAMNDDGETYLSYLSEGTSLGTSYTTKHNIVKDKAVQFSWGGSSVNSLRAVLGTYYNVRIYDCALTEEQLGWNRIVDDARYFGGIAETNLVVASNVRGLEGVEPSGEYMVNGSWTFMATNMTDGVFAWSPVGYSLEKWDGSDWVFFKNEEGAFFAYTNCTANGKMRLTWLWQQTGNVKGGYDVGDYIQGNLILHFDGIRNAGATADHDSSATTWANLGTLGSTYDAYKTEFASAKGSVGAWDNSGYYFKGKELFKIGNGSNGTQLNLGEKITVQVYSGFNASEQVADYPQFFGSIHGSKDRMQLYSYSAKLNFKADANGISTAISADWESPFINLVFDAENDIVRLGGETPQSLISGGVDLTSIDGYSYGIGAGQNNDSRRAARALCGNVHAVRVYKEVLDDWMLAYNNQIDNVRFNGNVTVVNGAVGETGTVGASSVADGVYDIASGTWTVTASEVVKNDKRYKPRLTVETLTDGEWVKTNRIWTDSYTIDKSALGADRIRLTWTWEKFSGLIISFR